MQLILFIGLQGAGKSTLYKQYFADTHIRLNQDMLKTKPRQRILFNACLESKTKTVIDKVNISTFDREPLIKKALEHKFEVIAYYFDVSIEDALLRNNQRTGKAKIDEIGVYGTLKRLEKPSFDEGFSEINYVTVLDNSFEVRQIKKVKETDNEV